MSLSLIAVFIPILLMGGIVGRLFREFAVTLSVAILISLVRVAHHHADDVRAAAARASRARDGAADWLARGPGAPGSTACCAATSAPWPGRCATAALMMLLLLATVGLNVYLYIIVPEGLLSRSRTPGG